MVRDYIKYYIILTQKSNNAPVSVKYKKSMAYNFQKFTLIAPVYSIAQAIQQIVEYFGLSDHEILNVPDSYRYIKYCGYYYNSAGFQRHFNRLQPCVFELKAYRTLKELHADNSPIKR